MLAKELIGDHMRIVKSDCPRGVVLLECFGEFDAFNLDRVTEAIDAIASERQGLVFDFTKLAFINSSGLKYLIELKHRLDASNKKMAVVAGDGFFAATIKTLGLAQVIPHFGTTAEAAEHCQAM